MSRSVDDFLKDLDGVLTTPAPQVPATGQATETTTDTATPRQDTPTGQDGTPAQQDRTSGQTVRVLTGRPRHLPDWWHGPRPLDDLTATPRHDTETRHDETDTETRQDTETGQDGADTATAAPDADTGHEAREEDTRAWSHYVRDEVRAGWKSAWSGRRTGTPEQNKNQAETEQDTTPPWDPTRVAGRILDAHRTRPVHHRATTAAQAALAAVTAPRASTGRLLYATSSITTAWWIGLTPWLTDQLHGAPIGVSIGLVIVTWSIHRATTGAAAPIRWCAHSLLTSSVIAAFLA